MSKNVAVENELEVTPNVVTLSDATQNIVASLNSQEVKQFDLIPCKVRKGDSIQFIDDRHADMLLMAAEITCDGGNITAEQKQVVHKAIETAVKASCRTAVAAWDKLVSDVSKANPKLTREDAILYALENVGRAGKVQKLAADSARMLESLK